MSEDSPILLFVVIAILVATFFTLASCEKRGQSRYQSIPNNQEAM